MRLSLFSIAFCVNLTFCLEPLRYNALRSTPEYQQLIKASQIEKDNFLRETSGRNNIVLALLAGANPNINKHAPFGAIEIVKNTHFLNAVNTNDLELVQLFFDCELHIKSIIDWWSMFNLPRLDHYYHQMPFNTRKTFLIFSKKLKEKHQIHIPNEIIVRIMQYTYGKITLARAGILR